jgi:hypothetical protein
MKLLCVTWHYPPSSEIAGKTTYRFLRACAARGHEVTVLTIPAPAGIALDPGFGRDVPDVRVVRIAPWPHLVMHAMRWKRRILRPALTASSATAPEVMNPSNLPLRRRLLDLYNLPDHGNGWIIPARRALRRLMRSDPPDVLFSVSPLFSAHVAALGAHRTFPDVPWWAWFHDPSGENTGTSRFRERCLTRWEATIATSATRAAVTTDELADDFKCRFVRRPAVLLCGYSPTEVPGSIDPPASGPMVLIHPGTLYGPRTPVPLLEAIAELRRSGLLDAADLTLRLIGDATDLIGESPSDAVARLGLGDMVTVEPVISQAAATAAVVASHVGVLLAEGQTLSIPAKTFDYVALRRPIFALADGATAAFVTRHDIGIATNRAKLTESLLRLVAEFRRDRLRAMTDRLLAAAPALTMDAQVVRFEQDLAIVEPASDAAAA